MKGYKTVVHSVTMNGHPVPFQVEQSRGVVSFESPPAHGATVVVDILYVKRSETDGVDQAVVARQTCRRTPSHRRQWWVR